MSLGNRFLAWVTGTIPGLAIAFVTHVPLIRAIYVIVAAIALIELLLAAGWLALTKISSKHKRMLGDWINIQEGGKRADIFSMSLRYMDSHPRISGTVVDANGAVISSWSSIYAHVLDSGSEMYYLYSGSPPPNDGHGTRVGTYGLCYLTFSGSKKRFSSAEGHFIDDHSAATLGNSPAVRETVRTYNRRIEGSLYKEIKMGYNYRYDGNDPASVKELVEHYCEYMKNKSD